MFKKPLMSGSTLLLAVLALSLLPVVCGQAAVIIDSDGVEHRFSTPFRRIISLYPAHTENLVEMGAADALIGISTADTHPESILDKARFSYHDSLEKFIEARPDCILIRPMIAHASPNLVKKLQQFGIEVISLQPTAASELFSYWQSLGTISGAEEGAQQMTLRFKGGLEKIHTRVEKIATGDRPRVYFESIHARMKTFSPNSIAIFCLSAAGGLNVADDAIPRRGTNIAGYTKEQILARAETIDVFLAQSGRMNRISVEEIASEPGFGAISAVRAGRIYLVDEDLVSRPTTRLLDGIEYIHRLLYRENNSEKGTS